MKTMTFIKRLEKQNNCKLADAHTETANDAIKTTYTGIKGADLIVIEIKGKLKSCKLFDLKTHEETELFMKQIES